MSSAGKSTMELGKHELADTSILELGEHELADTSILELGLFQRKGHAYLKCLLIRPQHASFCSG